MRTPPLSSPFLLLLSLFLSFTSAAVLTITIPSSNVLPNPNALPASTHATLTTLSTSSSSQSQSSHSLKARLTRSSTLVFPNLAPRASYLLDIHSREYVFAPYRVDVSADGDVIGVWETYRGHAWDNKGQEKAVGGVGDVVVEAKVIGLRKFYEERKGFSPMSLFKNPMILLGIFALAVTFGMPYLMENMDPEIKEEFERQRSGAGKASGGGGGGGGQPPVPGAGFDLAGWMAGTSPGPMDSVSKATTTARDGGQGSSRRR